VFPHKLFTALYQPDVFMFQCSVLCLEPVVVDLESLMGCTELGEVLISRFSLV